MKELVIPIKGMHCRSCEIMLTDSLEQLPDVSNVDVSLRTKTATIYAKHMPPEAAIRRAISKVGYEVGYDKTPWISKTASDYKDIFIAILFVAALAIIVSKIGIADITTGNVASGGVVVALLVGLTAGLSTCMALVGGLILGLSAKHAQKNPNATAAQKFRPHLFFNASRIVSFFILGGLIGGIGSAMQLSGPMLGVMMIAVGIVMFMLGLQLTRIFPRLSNGGLTIPASITSKLGLKERSVAGYSDKNAAILGAVSFFLPCGFTQAMQLYAISTGSITTGALVMGLFAVGTMPGLLGVGGLAATADGSGAKRFFKIAGVAVMAMAFINISNGYNLTGWQRPFAGATGASKKAPQEITANALTGPIDKPTKVESSAPIDTTLRATYTLASGMVPNVFEAKAKRTYTFEVLALEDGEGCMSTVVIPGLNNEVQYLEKNKTNKFTFKANRTGVYQITCAMGVPHGKIVVR